jgi:gluconokinase
MNHILVMGVAGAGKTTLAQALAQALSADFVDGDDFHTPEARAKMAQGKALSDADRSPWLMRLKVRLDQSAVPVVLACSALKQAYRDRLSVGICVYIHIEADLAVARLVARAGHFAGEALLASQLGALEPPVSKAGFNLITVRACDSTQVQLEEVLKHTHPLG